MSDEILSKEEIDALIAEANKSDADEVVEVQAESAEVASDVQNVTVAPAPAPEPVVRMQSEPVVRPVEFSNLGYSAEAPVKNGLDLIMDVHMNVAVELGRTTMQVREVLAMGPGSVVELDKHAGEPVEVVVNNKTVARGEVVVIDENFGVRITEIINSKDKETHARAA